MKDRKKKGQVAAASDFSINNCANADISISRERKSQYCKNTKKFMQLIDEDKVHDDDEEVPKEEENLVVVEKFEEDYADYGFDIWWLIAEHIMPEDVLHFALICRKTASVIQMEKFWMHLYHRFFQSTDTIALPTFLRPQGKRGNMRNIAIRSLFYTYTPFRLSVTRRANRDPACLIGKRLDTLWFVPGDKQPWTFFYKFRPRTNEKKQTWRRVNHGMKKKSHAENDHVLLIYTRQFRPLPQLHGQDVFLKSLTRPLATGFSEFALKLEFEDYKGNIVQKITYDSGVSVQVIDWFSPLYETTVKKLCDFSVCDDSNNNSNFFDD
uniref:F-box domain-containing protein n=1 Tax=Nyssomyia neivai TaxID=330878 RepID=A0A1L8DBJ7_9DIPT